jgi:hypothetical protein
MIHEKFNGFLTIHIHENEEPFFSAFYASDVRNDAAI